MNCNVWKSEEESKMHKRSLSVCGKRNKLKCSRLYRMKLMWALKLFLIGSFRVCVIGLCGPFRHGKNETNKLNLVVYDWPWILFLLPFSQLLAKQFVLRAYTQWNIGNCNQYHTHFTRTVWNVQIKYRYVRILLSFSRAIVLATFVQCVCVQLMPSKSQISWKSLMNNISVFDKIIFTWWLMCVARILFRLVVYSLCYLCVSDSRQTHFE